MSRRSSSPRAVLLESLGHFLVLLKLPAHPVAVHRRFVHVGHVGELGRPDADPMDLDVVGVAVAAVVVVDGEKVGVVPLAGSPPTAAQPPQYRPARSMTGRRWSGRRSSPNPGTRGKRRGVHRAAHRPVRPRLGPPIAQHLTVVQHAGNGLTALPAGGENENDPMAGPGEPEPSSRRSRSIRHRGGRGRRPLLPWVRPPTSRMSAGQRRSRPNVLPLGEHFVGVLTMVGRRPLDRSWGPARTGGRGRVGSRPSPR